MRFSRKELTQTQNELTRTDSSTSERNFAKKFVKYLFFVDLTHKSVCFIM